MSIDLISRSALLKMLKFKQHWVYGNGSMDDIERVIEDVKKAPAVDAEPVRHGRWKEIEESATGHLMECSVCKEWLFHNFNYVSNYCPNCGAKMDGDIDAAD